MKLAVLLVTILGLALVEAYPLPKGPPTFGWTKIGG
ncbi:uncharacterized protein LOC123037784 [Drosophila rhopaloa]|uniref:Uncharacterized protein n=1 Tax=Drosophila rhopaloa TaxID=1041015 RepID=A0ABM5JBA5_DRORH|nr:uncharacterized protein LOC123037784 [Drosophila rhopaloa]